MSRKKVGTENVAVVPKDEVVNVAPEVVDVAAVPVVEAEVVEPVQEASEVVTKSTESAKRAGKLTTTEAVEYLVKNQNGVLSKSPSAEPIPASVVVNSVTLRVVGRDIVTTVECQSVGCPYSVTNSFPLGDFEESGEKVWEVVA